MPGYRQRVVKLSATGLRRFHAAATAAWLLLGVPTFVLWLESVPWVVAMSWWANVASHWAAWQASRAEESGSPGA